MAFLYDRIIKPLFSDEETRFVAYLKRLKRYSIFWIISLLILISWFIVIPNLSEIYGFIIIYPQTCINWVLFSWIIVVVVMPFWWSYKPGDKFSENFKNGLRPEIWKYNGSWETELAENGKSVLVVTNSDAGGLVVPCLSWIDYELLFEARIVTSCFGWIVRASSLNDYFMVQVTPDMIRPHYRISGIWQLIKEEPHGLAIRVGEWFNVRTVVRGNWVTVYIAVAGNEVKVMQSDCLGDEPPAFWNIEIGGTIHHQFLVRSTRIGSFGFRENGSERGQVRNLNAYKLK